MDDQQAASQPAMTKPAQEGLRRNSLNLPRLAFIGLAYFSLALAPVLDLALGAGVGGGHGQSGNR